jgi:oligoribonuclease NrnB/cAMP/cGMP phosphodiesterase (DHH superfamily)
MNKYLMVSHTDLDGVSSLILALYYKLNFDRFVCIDYQDQDSDEHCKLLTEYDDFYYTDFSPSEKNLACIKPDSRIVVIDHHTSANKFLSQYIKDNPDRYINYTYDNEKCGTTLLLKWIEEKILKKPASSMIKEYCQLVEDYDLWKEHLGQEEFEKRLDLNRLLWKLCRYNATGVNKYEYFINNQLKKFRSNVAHFFYYDNEKSKIIESHEKEQEKLSQAKKSIMVRTDDRGKKFGIITMSSGSSIISHYILSERPDLDYLIIINCYNEENLKLSLRSKRFNLLKLQNVRGHEHAAGIDGWEQKDILKLSRNIIKSIPYQNLTR